VAYGQNGEMLRPENGYPLRLIVPGIQGVSWVKYLRRVEVGDKPYAAKDEAVHYMDLMPDGQHRQYTNIQECKSVVTTPSGGQVLLDKGFYNITGLALVGPRQSGQGRCVGGRWTQLASSAFGNTGAQQSADTFQHRLGVGRQARHHPKPRHRRNWVCAAHLQALACGARHTLDLSQQRHSVLVGARKR